MTQKEILEMASECGLIVTPPIEAFAKRVAAKEREVCATVCLGVKYDPTYRVRESFAQAIRNRGKL